MGASDMKRVVCVLLSAILTISLFPAVVAAPQPPSVDVPAAILIEKQTGTVLFEKDADVRRLPASVTKVMTLLLVMEAIDRGELKTTDVVTISKNAQSMGGSQVFLAEGETYTVHELLEAACMASGNDASVALAEHLAGTEETFVARMNERAAELNMVNTHFRDCTGLSEEDHYTSARDIALMSRELLKHEGIKKYTTQWMSSLRNGTFGLNNTNRLIRFYSGATGLKTGSTSTAKFCLSASAQREGMELIAVILGASSSDIRFDTARSLLDFGFANYGVKAVFPEEVLLPVPVILGKAAEVQPVVLENTNVLVEKSKMAGIERQVDLAPNVEAPVEKGQKLGELTVRAGDEVLARMPIVAGDAVERLGFFDVVGKMLGVLLMNDL